VVFLFGTGLTDKTAFFLKFIRRRNNHLPLKKIAKSIYQKIINKSYKNGV